MEFTATNLKADQFTFPVLELHSGDIDLIAAEVSEKIEQAPTFFLNAPVVIDLKSLPDTDDIEFAVLVGVLRSFGLNPVAIRGGTEAHAVSAETMELAILAEERKSKNRGSAAENGSTVSKPSQSVAPEPEQARSVAGNRTHHRPVRSGQKLASSTGDLIVIASTSAGSELIAAGNIHVYGTLRGRALAGVSGNENSRIFCHRLEAELVSIAGQYRVSEDIDESLRGRSVQIFLEADKLKIEPFGEH